jgi:hypothetical protein
MLKHNPMSRRAMRIVDIGGVLLCSCRSSGSFSSSIFTSSELRWGVGAPLDSAESAGLSKATNVVEDMMKISSPAGNNDFTE